MKSLRGLGENDAGAGNRGFDDGAFGSALHLLDGIDCGKTGDGGAIFLRGIDDLFNDLGSDQGAHGVVHENDVVGGRRNSIECLFDGLLAVLAADHQFHFFLFQDVACFFGQTCAECFDFVFAEGNPDLTDRIDRAKLAERVNEDRSACKIRELFGGMRSFAFCFCVKGTGHGSHARSEACSRNNDDDLHGGL